MARTIEYEGVEHTYGVANPNTRVMRYMNDFLNGEDGDSDINTMVSHIDGNPPQLAQAEVQWMVMIEVIGFFTNLLANNPALSGKR